MDEFKPGDLVRLKSGGPVMTVSEWDEDYEQFTCDWFDDKKQPQQRRFPATSLETFEDD